jgi:hypothetical protein
MWRREMHAGVAVGYVKEGDKLVKLSVDRGITLNWILTKKILHGTARTGLMFLRISISGRLL